MVAEDGAPVGKMDVRKLAVVCMAVAAGISVLQAVPTENIVAHFDSLDACLVEAANSAELRSTNIKVVNRYIATFLKQHAEISELLRVNSAGKVICEAVKVGKPGQRYRSVARQTWFREVTSTGNPYYGSLKTKQGRWQLFWAYPVRGGEGTRKKKFLGMLVARLDLATTVATAASRLEQPYLVEYEGKVLYKHQWQGGTGQKSLFDVKGMKGLALVTEIPPPPAVQPSVDERGVPSSESAVSKVPSVSVIAPSPSDSKTLRPDISRPSSRKRGIGFFFVPVFLVLAAIIIAVLWKVILRVIDAQQERLLRDIETRVGAPTVSPVGSLDVADLESLQGSNRAGGVTCRIPYPDSPVAGESAAGTIRTAGPPMGGALVSGPVQAGSSVSVSYPTSAPSSAPFSSGLPPGIDYEGLRRQLRSELEAELRAQYQKEFDHYRREVERGAEEFGAAVEMALHQLIGKISEMGDNPTQLTQVAGETIHEINAIVNRYRNQNR